MWPFLPAPGMTPLFDLLLKTNVQTRSRRFVVNSCLDLASIHSFSNTDDGSGSVTILESYRALIAADFRPVRTVEFHWYSAEV